MKHLIIILLLSNNCFGQQHEIPFPDSNAVWIQFRSQPVGVPPNYTYDQCHYKLFSHDTTHLNGFVYNNLYYDYYFHPIYNFEVLWEDTYSYMQVGLFRTDSLKVYYKPIVNGIPYPCYVGEPFDDLNPFDEHLLYDFGLEVGDTFDVQINKQIVLETIDSVDINGTFYRRLNFEQLDWYSGGDYYWIEGIGSDLGFFTYFNGFENYLSFECFHEDPDSSWFYPTFSYANSNVGCDYVGISELPSKAGNKVLVRMVDLMGRETEDKPNTTLIYIFSDGTTEKVYRME